MQTMKLDTQSELPCASTPGRSGNGASVVKVRLYSAAVTYRDYEDRRREETFPIRAFDHAMATDMAVAYVLQVLKLTEFELRVVGG